MRELVRKAVLFTILISGTQVISLPFGSLSLFQISLVLTILLGGIGFYWYKKIYTGKYLSFTIIYLISSIIAWAISSNPSWAKSYCLLGIMTTAMVFIISNYFEVDDICLLEKTIVRSQYIVFPFSIYSIITFYFRGGLPNKINLFAGLFIQLDNDSLRRGQASSQIRLMLPYSTPPVLSVAMAMCIMILLANKTLYKPITRRLLICLYGFILVFTASRTGIVGLGLGILYIIFRNMQRKGKLRFSHFIAILCGIVLVGVLFVYLGNSTYIIKMVHRFQSFNLLNDRHVLVPIDGLIIWVSSIKNFFFGIGFGSSVNMTGAHTYLPAYFLNSFVTLVAERGILGLVIDFMLIALTRSLLKKVKYERGLSVERDTNYDSLALCLLTGLLSCIFYEALNCYLLVFVISIAFMADR